MTIIFLNEFFKKKKKKIKKALNQIKKIVIQKDIYFINIYFIEETHFFLQE